jgi:thiol:disulfide interchange protein DsbD
MQFIRTVLLLLAVSLANVVTCVAQTSEPLGDFFADEPVFLNVDEAFGFDFSQQGDQLILHWQIADGYYLYKQQFKTVVDRAQLGEPVFPAGEMKEDEFFEQPQEVFHHQVSIVYSITHAEKDSVVKIRYQGCAEAGLCYPPTTKVVYLNKVVDQSANNEVLAGDEPSAISSQFALVDLLTDENNLLWILLIFLALGIGLAFTPCVFPMYPILSGIVIGQGKTISTSRAFILSLVYVQGMALTYSLLGLAVASAGVQFQASLQHPAILLTLIVIFVALALVMFGAYELQLPSSWQEKLNGLSNKQTSGTYFGVLLMGAISGLVASPCTTAPLTGILLYIAQSGDLLLGFSALYALSLGMGIPLILFAITGGKLLPKAGAWMNIVKITFGFMMLAVALMFVERMVSHIATDIAWSVLGLATFSYFYVMNLHSALTFYKGLRTLGIFCGLFGSAMYGYQTLHTTTAASGYTSTVAHPKFLVVKDIADFNTKLAQANAAGKSVMVDLYADWCVACKEFEKYTFTNPDVITALGNTQWMQIDLTDNTAVNLEFQEHFGILGLPTILFFDTQGQEVSSARVTGFMRAEPFVEHVKAIF